MTVLALVHRDGHIARIASARRQRTELAAGALLLAEAGVPGWSAIETADLAGIAAGLAGYGRCQVCTMNLACGCALAHAVRGMCPHGGGAVIHAAIGRLGL